MTPGFIARIYRNNNNLISFSESFFEFDDDHEGGK
jgi:hypothetical protein